MNNNLRQRIFISSSFLLFLFLVSSGCEKVSLKRNYHEVVLESDQPVAPSGSFMKGTMPQDDIHKGLTMPQGMPPGMMPQDDIHKGLTMPQGMPQGMMPQDDIHAGLSMKDMQNMPMNAQLSASVDRTPLKWVTPKGWTETKGNGMRLVTFNNADQNDPVEVTIVSLGGPAGGLEANVTRWMRQINLNVPAPAALDAFLKGLEKVNTDSGLPAVFVDFTKMQKDAKPDAASMAAVIIERDNAQIFVKMTGSKQAIEANLNTFKSLFKSIEVNQ